MTHEHCGTCGRSTAACPECSQLWPDGVPGFLDSGGWHNGHRPPASETRPPELVRAEQKADDAQVAYDAARAEWQRRASGHYSARHRSMTEGTTVIGSDGVMRDISPVSAAEIAALAAAEESTKAVMDAAGAELVEARMEHRAATGAVHRATA